MNENGFGRRYLEKMRGLMREDAHIARANDLLARIKIKLPSWKSYSLKLKIARAKKMGSTVFTIMLIQELNRWFVAMSAVIKYRPLFGSKKAPVSLVTAGPEKHVDLLRVSQQTTIYSLADREWSQRRTAR